MTVAQCRVSDASGVEVVSMKPLYPVKRWSRYRINQDYFLDLKYDGLDSEIGVKMVEVPHYPWTVSERTLRHSTLKMVGESPKLGVLSLETVRPGARLTCREIKES